MRSRLGSQYLWTPSPGRLPTGEARDTPVASSFTPRRHKIDFSIGGGRSSVSGIVATVFGSTGFVGRYVVNQLGRVGSQVVIPFRGEEKAYNHLKVMGDLGQIVPIKFDLRDKESLRAAMAHSNVVINLVGQPYDTRNFTMYDVHVDGAQRIAEVAKEMGIDRFVHVSALDVAHDSESDWVRSKAEGERAVRKTHAKATILRPGPIWGAQDHFLNTRGSQFRYWPVYLLINKERKMQPVFVNDVATAIMSTLGRVDTMGKTYELQGPDTFTEKDLSEWIAMALKIRKPMVEPSADTLWNLGYWLGQHRNPRYTLDSIKRVEDQVATGSLPSWSELDIPNDHLQPLRSQLAVSYLLPFRYPVRAQDVDLDYEPDELKRLNRDQPIRPIF